MAIQQNLSVFFQDDLPAYGAYDNTRKIASYVDGQKISMRKILYTLIKKYPGAEKIKTDTVANVCAAFTNYLHGSANLCGVCDTMAQSFVGANNYPLIEGNSSGFGTRINPVCAAARYTKISLSKLTETLLNKDDEEIIGKQFFEGSYIEPKFFVPIFPILFLNGSHGLSTGFAQDIYPRNPNEIITYIKKKIGGTKNPKCELLPWFKDHKGKVEFNKDTGKIESFGIIVKNNLNSYTISELPIGMEYQKYIELLDKLCENGTIVDYDDLCDTKTDTIHFEIKTTREFSRKNSTERSLLEELKLIKTLPEVLCCIDENNRVREFNSVQEILDAFINVRLDFYSKRKDYILKTTKDKINKLNSKYLFCNGIIKNEIKVAKVKKEEIIKQLEAISKIVKIDGSYNYLLNMPIHSISYETLEELKKEIQETKDYYNEINSKTIENIWIEDLSELEKVLKSAS